MGETVKTLGSTESGWNIVFFHILGTTIPTDFNSIIFQRGFAQNHQPAISVVHNCWPHMLPIAKAQAEPHACAELTVMWGELGSGLEDLKFPR